MIYGRMLEEDDEEPYFYDPFEDGDEYDPETACGECGKPGADYCQCCGVPLCYMHSEIGCGFCKDCPVEGWSPDYNQPAPERGV